MQIYRPNVCKRTGIVGETLRSMEALRGQCNVDTQSASLLQRYIHSASVSLQSIDQPIALLLLQLLGLQLLRYYYYYYYWYTSRPCRPSPTTSQRASAWPPYPRWQNSV